MSIQPVTTATTAPALSTTNVVDTVTLSPGATGGTTNDNSNSASQTQSQTDTSSSTSTTSNSAAENTGSTDTTPTPVIYTSLAATSNPTVRGTGVNIVT